MIPTQTLTSVNHPQPSHPPIICSNNKMAMISLAQIRQSDGCGSVRNDEIFSIQLEIWCGSLSQHPLPHARHQPHLLIPSAQTIKQEESKKS